MKKKSRRTRQSFVIVSPFVARRRAKAFEAEFERVFHHLFEPGLANVLAAARIPPTYEEARYQDDGDRFKAVFSAVHDLTQEAVSHILGAAPVPCAAHGKS